MNRSVIFLLFAFCITVSCLAHNNKNKKDEIDIKIDIDVKDGGKGNGNKHHGGHGSHNADECKEEHQKPTKTTRKPIKNPTRKPTPRVPQYECPSGFKLFKRSTPWCLKVILKSTSIASGKAQDICKAAKSNLSNFENKHETDVMLAPLYSSNSNYSLTVDGRRVPKCMKIKANSHDSPCTIDKTFYFPHKNTNSAYTIQNFYSGQPDSQQRTINSKFYIEDCLTIYIAKGSAMDKKYNDIFCDFAVSPVSSNQIYQSRGALCGVAATRKR